MRYPHPWLARLAAASLVFGVAGFVSAAGVVLPPGPSGHWYGSRVLASWQMAAVSGQYLTTGRNQFENTSIVLLVPGGWLLAAGVLRLASTGRVHVTGPVPPHWRWLATTGMGFSLVAVGCGAARWECPLAGVGGNARALDRIRTIIQDGVIYDFDYESRVGDWSPSFGTMSPGPGSPKPLVWTTVVVLCGEAYALFACVRTAGVVFLLSATLYCLSTRDADAET